MSAPGQLYVVSAPSGAGKGTLIRRLLADDALGDARPYLAVSHTTRRPRSGERSGEDYYFVDRPTFERMVGEDAFLEWAEVHRQLYGTSHAEVAARLERGTDVLLEIDVQGAEQVRRAHPAARGIFIMPPSYQELERRLRGRGLDEPDDIAYRLSVSLSEMERYADYEYVIINDDAARAARALAAIFLEPRQQRARLEGAVERILAEVRRVADPG